MKRFEQARLQRTSKREHNGCQRQPLQSPSVNSVLENKSALIRVNPWIKKHRTIKMPGKNVRTYLPDSPPLTRPQEPSMNGPNLDEPPPVPTFAFAEPVEAPEKLRESLTQNTHRRRRRSRQSFILYILPARRSPDRSGEASAKKDVFYRDVGGLSGRKTNQS